MNACMTKLVDVQGLKPCPEWGSGSSPDIGSIHNFLCLVVIKLTLFHFTKLFWVCSTTCYMPAVHFALITSSWLVHCLFIFVFLLAFVFKPAASKIINISCF